MMNHNFKFSIYYQLTANRHWPYTFPLQYTLHSEIVIVRWHKKGKWLTLYLPSPILCMRNCLVQVHLLPSLFTSSWIFSESVGGLLCGTGTLQYSYVDMGLIDLTCFTHTKTYAQLPGKGYHFITFKTHHTLLNQVIVVGKENYGGTYLIYDETAY